LNEPQRAELWTAFAGEIVKPKPPPTPRSFQKEWKVNELLPALDEASQGRSFAKGQQAFNDAQCIACHRFGNDGGSVGSDLTAVSSRFTRRDILDSILEPSKVVSEQYQNTTIVKKNGDDITGRVVEEDDQKVVLVSDPIKQDRVEVRKSEIQRRVPSKVSPMPEGLVNVLTKEEILDLLAYLESGGRVTHAAFK
jgi:putative heme-binding domain-containing protein